MNMILFIGGIIFLVVYLTIRIAPIVVNKVISKQVNQAQGKLQEILAKQYVDVLDVKDNKNESRNQNLEDYKGIQ